jgi:sugar phosphate isomerase/epimerase
MTAFRDHFQTSDRRVFLKGIAGALALANTVEGVSPDWRKQVGLELFTVRDLTQKDYQGTLEKVAEIGYKEVEPAGGYGGLSPKDFRALLDRLGLAMPSTHSAAREGPDLEKELEGFQVMGLKYIEIGGGGGRGRGAAGPAPTAAAAQPAAARGPRPPQTEEAVKRQVDQLNKHGEIAKKFGMKMLVHNHTQEFAFVEGSDKLRPYDILLAQTDPALVAMQLDIGWASVAGQNILGMFHKNPGRFELWHVKDVKGLKDGPPQDLRTAKLVPVGIGEIDYKAIFKNADLAGMKHYCVEQDNAAESGDALAAARTSYQNLIRMLS